ncbi:hypothetical protein N7448_010931 [Penicillium atrosanguineum]|uniref:AB hydrolase-1 domain-containing protein n=1 Tax=Penicillium atrosanguineum TaxID=1132637 RepID=A0A9W9KUB7_9EURO|nr:hypothetical protein N7448_010931 [Penicillium atrosanguineum]KAJ5300022.1 hypothetical protein N7476_011579 [Penicillium atrosanguineum]
MSNREGTIPFDIPNVQQQCFTWYRAIGDINKTPPLILIHGGPGTGSDYHLHLAKPLEAAGISCIFYDQVGCGRSSLIRERAEDESFWGFDLFCAELDNLVDHFELRRVGFSIYGHSWGGMLASIYAGRKPRGLSKLVIANSIPSAALSAKESERLFRLLPVDDTIIQMDADGDYDNPVYREAGLRFMEKHFCILEPWPAALTGTGVSRENSTRMWKGNGKKGISLIRQLGFMHDYDAIKTAGDIEVPVLLLTGRYDKNNEVIMGPWFKSIPRVKWAVLEKSSHMPAFEEPARFAELLTTFLL